MAHILIVEDDINLGQILFQELKKHNHVSELVESAEAAMARINKYIYDLIITDLKLPGMDGLELLKKIKGANQSTIVIVMTGYASVDTAVVAMKNGAHDFIQKPFGLHEIVQKVDDALALKRMKNEIDYLRHAQENIIYRTSDIIGVSPSLKKVLHMAEKVAKADSTLLLTGETGVGKGLIAGAIHHNSNRADNNFVQVNCAALPQNILESELFGHERGAFTGAVKLRTGRFEQANMGTIFLDEIGDMDMSLQSKILRVLEEREFERVGGERTIKVDVRVIAATNQDLYKMVQDGKFREDLYYRINVVNIFIPPIRERKEDIEPLVRYFIKKYSLEFNKPEMDIDLAALDLLKSYDWPGNVREIRNCIERAVLLSDGSVIRTGDISIQSGEPRMAKESGGNGGLSSLALNEKEIILDALRKNDWIQKDAAETLGISKRVIHYKIRKYGITHPRWIKNR
ncbi:MAG: sigma-54-dependent transcriptional regulator [Desulfomonilia bacterium]|uniref:Regulatory protein AtoC n=1 Tax=anaerobic digester metagenome TaxID=1263854 RepID=A0A485M220_9ZZZZ|nr:sigma-54 dependent transcriptional regulator [Pseudomonadota bacterium]HON37386.1 sigma-54 dependent transcriptional regulator [Deltaproteobacteria bacterium]HRS55515.1 sigma-54 dependent transcriptional regulator [Desulfomonilia bacterium]HPD20563.1 sigma-54 dependent transcriptional regulator [Deltaproteobacteria bacterium]HPX17293.1 sigma-54 dependent transcriptional regulator [Deltaproteobacteria bacterium]